MQKDEINVLATAFAKDFNYWPQLSRICARFIQNLDTQLWVLQGEADFSQRHLNDDLSFLTVPDFIFSEDTKNAAANEICVRLCSKGFLKASPSPYEGPKWKLSQTK